MGAAFRRHEKKQRMSVPRRILNNLCRLQPALIAYKCARVVIVPWKLSHRHARRAFHIIRGEPFAPSIEITYQDARHWFDRNVSLGDSITVMLPARSYQAARCRYQPLYPHR